MIIMERKERGVSTAVDPPGLSGELAVVGVKGGREEALDDAAALFRRGVHDHAEISIADFVAWLGIDVGGTETRGGYDERQIVVVL